MFSISHHSGLLVSVTLKHYVVDIIVFQVHTTKLTNALILKFFLHTIFHN